MRIRLAVPQSFTDPKFFEQPLKTCGEEDSLEHKEEPIGKEKKNLYFFLNSNSSIVDLPISN